MDISLRLILSWNGGIIKKRLNLNSRKSLQDQNHLNIKDWRISFIRELKGVFVQNMLIKLQEYWID